MTTLGLYAPAIVLLLLAFLAALGVNFAIVVPLLLLAGAFIWHCRAQRQATTDRRRP